MQSWQNLRLRELLQDKRNFILGNFSKLDYLKDSARSSFDPRRLIFSQPGDLPSVECCGILPIGGGGNQPLSAGSISCSPSVTSSSSPSSPVRTWLTDSSISMLIISLWPARERAEKQSSEEERGRGTNPICRLFVKKSHNSSGAHFPKVSDVTAAVHIFRRAFYDEVA